MEIIISNFSTLPIYEQIYNQIKEAIISEKITEDYKLPSMRSLAKDLKISVITTKRAYDELEKDGFIYTISSKGSYVKGKNLDFIKDEYFKNIEKNLMEAKHLAKLVDLNDEELLDIFKYILEEER